jgi:hypothetical protein
MIQFPKWERKWNYSVSELCPSIYVFWDYTTFLKGERLGNRQDPLLRFRIFRRWTKFRNLVTPSVICHRQDRFEGNVFLCLPSLHFSSRFSFSFNDAASEAGMINVGEAFGGIMADKGNRHTTLWEHLPRRPFVNNIIPHDYLGSNPCRRCGKLDTNHQS